MTKIPALGPLSSSAGLSGMPDYQLLDERNFTRLGFVMLLNSEWQCEEYVIRGH